MTPEANNNFHSAIGVWLLTNSVDLSLTFVGLSMGFNELNPLANDLLQNYNESLLVAAKIALPVLLASLLLKATPPRSTEFLTGYIRAANTFSTLICVFNGVQIILGS